MVMKNGEVVEQASVDDVMNTPRQEYTRNLLDAVPRGHAVPG